MNLTCTRVSDLPCRLPTGLGGVPAPALGWGEFQGLHWAGGSSRASTGLGGVPAPALGWGEFQGQHWAEGSSSTSTGLGGVPASRDRLDG